MVQHNIRVFVIKTNQKTAKDKVKDTIDAFLSIHPTIKPTRKVNHIVELKKGESYHNGRNKFTVPPQSSSECSFFYFSLTPTYIVNIKNCQNVWNGLSIGTVEPGEYYHWGKTESTAAAATTTNVITKNIKTKTLKKFNSQDDDDDHDYMPIKNTNKRKRIVGKMKKNCGCQGANELSLQYEKLIENLNVFVQEVSISVNFLLQYITPRNQERINPKNEINVDGGMNLLPNNEPSFIQTEIENLELKEEPNY